MAECVECGHDTEGDATLCAGCAGTDVVEAARAAGEDVADWATCPLCDGSGRCFFCSAGGPCYHCSGSGREMPGTEAECHVCGGVGETDKGCAMCGYTRRCKHCGGSGRVPASVLHR